MPEFSQKLFDTICERIADGESLRAICRDKDMPSTTAVLKWLVKDDDGPLVAQYARARKAAADANAEDVVDIGQRTLAGEFDPQAARVAIDALKWSAGKRNPKKYGDKVAIGGDDDAPPIRVAAQVDFTKLSTTALKELEGVLSQDDPSADD